MPEVLPNLADEVLIRYGIPELYERFPFVFKDTPREDKITIAICDQGVSTTETKYDIWENAAEIPNNGIDDDGNGFIDDAWGWSFVSDSNVIVDANSHGKTAANALVAAAPEAIRVMNVQIATSSGSHFDAIDGMNYAAMNGALAANCSFRLSSTTLVDATLMRFNNLGCLWTAPAIGSITTLAYNSSYDGMVKFPSLITTGAISRDHSIMSASQDYNGQQCMFFAYAGAISFASPVPTGLAAILKRIDPSLTHIEIRDLIVEGAQHISIDTEQRSRFGIINHKNSVEALLGHKLSTTYIPPIPEPEPMYTIQVITPLGTFSAPQQWLETGWRGQSENMDMLFDGDKTTKGLIKQSTAYIDFTPAPDLGTYMIDGVSIITGNDVPDRDPKTVIAHMLDGRSIEATFDRVLDRREVSDALFEEAIDLSQIEQFELHNWAGDMLQLSEFAVIESSTMMTGTGTGEIIDTGASSTGTGEIIDTGASSTGTGLEIPTGESFLQYPEKVTLTFPDGTEIVYQTSVS